MEAESDPVLDPANKLRVSIRCRRRETAPARLAIHRQYMSERELQSSAVAPRSNGIGELDRLGAALESKTGKCIRHEALTESRVDGPEHEVGAGRPDKV